MDFTVVLDHEHHTVVGDGTSVHSHVIYIPPGKTALLSLYNMASAYDLVTDETTGKKSLQSNDCIVVKKMSFGQTGDIIRKLKCGEEVNIQDELQKLLSSRRVFTEPVFQCGGAWAINPCNNFALIPTPGFYILEFTDIAQLDSAYVEYALLDVSDSTAIPDEFKLGSK